MLASSSKPSFFDKLPRSVAIISLVRLLAAAAHAPIGKAFGVMHWKA